MEHFTERRLDHNLKKKTIFLNDCLVEPGIEPITRETKIQKPGNIQFTEPHYKVGVLYCPSKSYVRMDNEIDVHGYYFYFQENGSCGIGEKAGSAAVKSVVRVFKFVHPIFNN